MKRRGERGFSLIETIVALGIFGIALGSLPPLLISTMRANARAAEITVATSLAQEKLEELSLTPLAVLASGADAGPLGADGEPGQGGIYSRSWTVAAGPSPAGASSRLVTVSVSWPGHGARAVTLSTILSL